MKRYYIVVSICSSLITNVKHFLKFTFTTHISFLVTKCPKLCKVKQKTCLSFYYWFVLYLFWIKFFVKYILQVFSPILYLNFFSFNEKKFGFVWLVSSLFCSLVLSFPKEILPTPRSLIYSSMFILKSFSLKKI